MPGRCFFSLGTAGHRISVSKAAFACPGPISTDQFKSELLPVAILAASERIQTYVRKITGQHSDDEEVAILGDQIANEIIKTLSPC